MVLMVDSTGMVFLKWFGSALVGGEDPICPVGIG